MPSTYRVAIGVVTARVQSYAWIVLLPAAAECTASVWFPSISYDRLDLQLAALNISGALFEGFFAAWENGVVVPNGPMGKMLAFISDDVRGSFLSTYTSWAGMVGFAAALAHSEQSLVAGGAYMVGCVLCGFIAHALGQRIAVLLFARKGTAVSVKPNQPNLPSSALQSVLLVALISYIVGTYILVLADIQDFEDADAIAPTSGMPALLAFFDEPHRRLLVMRPRSFPRPSSSWNAYKLAAMMHSCAICRPFCTAVKRCAGCDLMFDRGRSFGQYSGQHCGCLVSQRPGVNRCTDRNACVQRSLRAVGCFSERSHTAPP